MNKSNLKYLLLLLFVSPTWADDSIEASSTGNIVFEKVPQLIMEDETLTINKSKGEGLGTAQFSIDVDFHFKNTSSEDITRKIAFVLPPILCREDMRSSWTGLDADNPNQPSKHELKDFTVVVNGESKSFTKRTEALIDKRNITELLNKHNIPLNPCKIQVTAEGKPDPRYSKELEKNHLLTSANEPEWSEHIYFEWTQTFPAGKTINIHHHYSTPSGGSVVAPRSLKELNETLTQNNSSQQPIWNKSPDTLATTHPSLVKTDGTSKRFCVMPEWVRYQLTTGANWNGGIRNFKLIIKDDADAPFAINKFYKDKNAQVSIDKNTMTFTMKDFVPTENLHIQFLSLPQTENELQSCG